MLTPWGRSWHLWSSVAFVKSYLEHAGSASFLPQAPEHMQTLLNFYFLARGVFELRYQLLNRPDRVHIPVRAMLYLLEMGSRKTVVLPAEEPTR